MRRDNSSYRNNSDEELVELAAHFKGGSMLSHSVVDLLHELAHRLQTKNESLAWVERWTKAESKK